MGKVGDFFVDIGARLTGFKKAQREASASLRKISADSDKTGKKLRKAFASAGERLEKFNAGLGKVLLPAAIVGVIAGVANAFADARKEVARFSQGLLDITNKAAGFGRAYQEELSGVTDEQKAIRDLNEQIIAAQQEVNAALEEEMTHRENIFESTWRSFTTGKRASFFEKEKAAALDALAKQQRNQTALIEDAFEARRKQAAEEERIAKALAAQEAERVKELEHAQALAAFYQDIDTRNASIIRARMTAQEQAAADAEAQIDAVQAKFDALSKKEREERENRRDLEQAIYQIRISEFEKIQELEKKAAEERKREAEELIRVRVEGIQREIDKEKELQDLQNRQVGQFGSVQVGAGGAIFNDQGLLNSLTFNGMGGTP